MSLGSVHAGEHLHISTKTLDGAEFASALYQDDVEAALAFCGIVQHIRKYATDGAKIAIEDVMRSIQEGRGMYAGVPGFIVVLLRCDGGCMSSSWN